MYRVDVADNSRIPDSKFFRATEKTWKVDDLGGDIPILVRLGTGTTHYRVNRIHNKRMYLDGRSGSVHQADVTEAKKSWADLLDYYTNVVIYLVLELRRRGHGFPHLSALMIQTSEVAPGTDPEVLEFVRKSVKFLWPRSRDATEDKLRLALWHYGPQGKLRPARETHLKS